MPADYSKFSPYFQTEKFGPFLDIMNARPVPKSNLDSLITISSVYQYRPDLMAADLYGYPQLWWVFAARNPNVIQDPVFDFFAGQQIYIPKSETLLAALGI